MAGVDLSRLRHPQVFLTSENVSQRTAEGTPRSTEGLQRYELDVVLKPSEQLLKVYRELNK